MEEKRANLESVKHKSDSLIQDLSRVERNMVERWTARLSTENQRVMEIVDSQNKLLAEHAGEQAIFQESLNKVNLWLQDKEQEVQKLQQVRLTSSDIDKQIEKSKVSINIFSCNLYIIYNEIVVVSLISFVPIVMVFQFIQGLVYIKFQFIQGLVLYKIPVYLGFGLYRILDYSGFGYA